MTALVVPHITLGAEAFAAVLRASEGSLILVDSDVNIEVLFLAECLIAPREITLERLRSVVQVHVGVETNFAAECFVTTVMRAEKGQIALTLHLKALL